MSDNNPLSNPTINDFNYEPESQDVQESLPILKGQMHLDLGENSLDPRQLIGATKTKLKRRAVILEFSSVWRNPAVPFALTTLVLTPLILLTGGMFEFNKIPPRIPFYYNSVSNHWEQFDKALVFLFPLVLAAIEAIIMNLAIKIFPHDKKLSISISWIIVFINILLLIAIGQIYTLIT